MTCTSPFWTIPPIQDAIASHLDPSDFRNCVKVSSLLHQVFIPFLWSNINITHEADLALLAASSTHAQNRHHVKSLSVDPSFTGLWTDYTKAHGPLRGLASLTIGHQYLTGSQATLELLESLASHPQLKDLEIEFLNTTSDGIQDAFLYTMARLSYLRRVKVKLQLLLEAREVVVLLGAFRNVNELDLTCSVSPNLSMDDVLSMTFPTTKIRDLSIHPLGELGLAVHVRFVASCPDLSRLRLFTDTTMTNQSYKGLYSLLTTHCALLQDLCLFNVPAMEVAKMLEFCPSLKRLQVRTEYHYEAVVESAIMRYHGHTLEVLDLGHWQDNVATMWQLVEFVDSCPRLKSLMISVWWPSSVVQDVNVVETLVGRPWPSKGIGFEDVSLYTVYEDSGDGCSSEGLEDGYGSEDGSGLWVGSY